LILLRFWPFFALISRHAAFAAIAAVDIRQPLIDADTLFTPP